MGKKLSVKNWWGIHWDPPWEADV